MVSQLSRIFYHCPRSLVLILTTKLRCFLYFLMSSSLPVLLALFFNRDRSIIAFLRDLFMCCLSLPLTILFLDGACNSKMFKKSLKT